jgi:hypothetical protein
VPAPRVLSRAAEGGFRYEMAMLDTVLLGHPGRIPGQSKIGFYVEPFKYKTFLDHLSCLAEDRQSVLKDLGLSSIPIPSLPKEWPSDSL